MNQTTKFNSTAKNQNRIIPFRQTRTVRDFCESITTEDPEMWDYPYASENQTGEGTYRAERICNWLVFGIALSVGLFLISKLMMG